MLNILFLGDVTARSGRDAVVQNLPALKKEYDIDFTIINGENAAHGKGITTRIYRSLKEAGADVITLGNHAFSKHEIIEHLNECPDLIRPVNIAPVEAGNSFLIRTCRGKRIAVINLLGSIFMDVATEDPFSAMERLLPQIDADIRFVDFHAETTSEKQIFFQVYKEKLNAVIGTHTHVQTADECVRSGCAYLTDAGMCGPYDSIIGRDVNEVIRRMVYHEQTRFTPAEGPAVLCGCVIRVDEATNRTAAIERIQKRPE